MGKQHSKQLEQYVKVTEVFRGLAAWRNNECWCVRSMGRKDGQGLPSMLRTDDSPCISHAAVISVIKAAAAEDVQGMKWGDAWRGPGGGSNSSRAWRSDIV